MLPCGFVAERGLYQVSSHPSAHHPLACTVEKVRDCQAARELVVLCPSALPPCLQDSLCLLCPAPCPRRGLLEAAATAWTWPIEGTRMRRQGGRLLLFCFSLPGCCVWGTAASRWPAALEGWNPLPWLQLLAGSGDTTGS